VRSVRRGWGAQGAVTEREASELWFQAAAFALWQAVGDHRSGIEQQAGRPQQPQQPVRDGGGDPELSRLLVDLRFGSGAVHQVKQPDLGEVTELQHDRVGRIDAELHGTRVPPQSHQPWWKKYPLHGG